MSKEGLRSKSYSTRIDRLTGSDHGLNLSDQHVRVQEIPGLPEELSSGTQEILEYFEENNSFLPKYHEITQKIQEWADKIKSPSAHGTQIMVLLDSQINAFALPDGTIIYTAGLINRLIQKNVTHLLPYPLLHEVPHFERSHTEKTHAYWFGDSGINGIKKDHVSLIGMKRWHEYEADMTALFNAEKLELPAIEYSTLLRVITAEDDSDETDEENGDEESYSESNIDFVHGNTYDRELNVALAHTILEFTNSSKEAPPVHFQNPGKIKIPASQKSRLKKIKDPEELNSRFAERSPNFRTIFIQEEIIHVQQIYSDYRYGKEKGNQALIDQSKKKMNETFQRLGFLFADIENTIRLQFPENSEPQVRHAIQTVMNRLGNENVRSLWNYTEKIENEIEGIKVPQNFKSYLIVEDADFTLEAYQDYLSWNKNEKLFSDLRINAREIKQDDFPSFLWPGSGLPELLFEGYQFRDRTVEEVLTEMGRIAQYMEQEKYFDEDTSWRFGLIGAEKLIQSYLRYKKTQGATEETLILETVRLLHYTKDKLDVRIWSLNRFSEAILGMPSYTSHPRQKYIENQIAILREPASENFMTVLKDQNPEQLLKFINLGWKTFNKELGKVMKAGDYDEADWNFIQQTILEHWNEVQILWPIDFSDFRMSEKIEEIWGDLLGAERFKNLVKEETGSQTHEEFSRLRLLLEAGYIFASEGNFDDKDSVLASLFEEPLVKAAIEHISVFQLDHILRSYYRETTNLTIDVLETTWSKYELELNNDYNEHNQDTFEMGDAVLDVLPISLYEQKLRELVQPESLEEVTNYHNFLMDLVALYGYGGYFHKEQSIPTEKSAQLLEPATTLYYQKVYEHILEADSWEKQRDLYYFLKQDFSFRPDDKRVLSTIQQRLITDPNAPIDFVLDFIEGETNEGFLTVETIRSFVQLRIKDYSAFKQFSDRITHIIDSFTSNRAKDIGAAAMSEQLIEYFSSSYGSFQLFRAALRSGQDDTELRALLAPWYWQMWVTKKNLSASLERGYEVKLDEKDEPYVSGASLQNFVTFDEVIQYLYDMPEMGKMLLLRKLFLSKTGLLVDPAYAKEMSGIFVSSLEEDDSLTPRIEAITEAAISVGDPVYMFLTFSQALMPLMFQKPTKQADVHHVAREIRFDPTNWDMRNFDNIYFNREQVAKILNFKPPHKEESESNPTIQKMLKQYAQVVDELDQKFDVQDNTPRDKNEKNKPVEVVKKIGSATAPIGTGLLQISAQFTPLEGPYAELLDVYDSNEGQTYYSAMYTMERIGEKNPEVQRFLNEQFISFIKEVGTGKVATSIHSKVFDENGKAVNAVIKILNPNALTWTRIMSREAKNIMEYIEEEKTLSPKDISIANKSLDIVEAWVEEELVDPNYLPHDDIVRSIHENQRTSTRFQVRFPKRLGPQTDTIKVDEYIDGENIGRFFRNPEHEPEVKIEAAQALADIIIRSLTEPHNGQYYLLKDHSQGNAIITTEAIYPLDRQFAVIDQKDRDFIHGFLSEGLTLRSIDQMVNYFGDFPENSQISQKKRRAIGDKLKRTFASDYIGNLKDTLLRRPKQNPTNFIDTVNTVIKVLDEEKMVVPAYFRLFILKTLVSMNTLFQEAGVKENFQEYYKKRSR